MSGDIENILNLNRDQGTSQGNVALFIDHDNMFLGGQDNGISRGYDFDILIKICKKYGRIVFARAYGKLERKQHEFFKRGIDPIYTPYLKYEDGTKKSLADPIIICDILQALYEISYIDTFMIATNDMHFVPVLLNISKYKEKKQVIVIGFDDNISKRLIETCDNLGFEFCDYKKEFEQCEDKYNEGT